MVHPVLICRHKVDGPIASRVRVDALMAEKALKNPIDLRRHPPLLSAPMNKIYILVVGRRVGKAV